MMSPATEAIVPLVESGIERDVDIAEVGCFLAAGLAFELG